MAYEDMGVGALDYEPCYYGESKLQFRGPPKRLDQPYWAVLGNSESYGKFIEEPYPAILEQKLEQPVVNLGCKNAGTDVFLLDQTVIEICAAAEVTIVQVMGVQNLSNRLYSVHPRRNDRFLCATPLVRTMFGDVDLTDIHFTRHFLNRLKESSVQKFATVREELKSAWVDRMQALLTKISGRTILLWIADHAPGANPGEAMLCGEPLLVDKAMLDQLAPYVSDYVEVIGSREEISAGHDRMVFTSLEAVIAKEMLGPVVHDIAARALFARTRSVH